MVKSKFNLPVKPLPVVRLSLPVGLAMFLLVVLLWMSASNTAAMEPPLPAAEMSSLNQSQTITIGMAADLTGPVNAIGWQEANAVKLAVDQTNAAGGIEVGGVGYTLTLVVADSACNPGQAVVAANTLLNAGVVAVVGHSCSSASMAAQSLYYAAGVPMISPSASAINLTEQGYNTTFRVVAKDNAQAILLATYFRQWLGIDAVALVAGSGYEWSTAAFSSTFTSLGGAITSQRSVTSTDEYTATLTSILSENPDLVFFAELDGANAGFFSKIADSLGLDVIGWDTIFGDDVALGNYATAAGEAAEGDYAGLNGRLTDDMPGYADFNAAYQAAGYTHSGDEAGMYGAYAYDAVKIILAAIIEADSVNPTDIRDLIAATASYTGVVGNYTGFDANGDVIPQWAFIKRYQNDQWITLAPSWVFLSLVLSDE